MRRKSNDAQVAVLKMIGLTGHWNEVVGLLVIVILLVLAYALIRRRG